MRHPWLFALPNAVLPAEVVCANRSYRLVETFKHDFFAGTGLYADADGDQIVVKFGRVTALFGLPTAWIGRLLRNREAWFYERLHDLPGVPAYTGSVEPNGMAHAFIPGAPLGRRDDVDDRFFGDLQELLRAIHGRGMAYVDLNKRQNILKGADGRPYLIDFQISAYCRSDRWHQAPLRWLLRRCQNADEYHLLKHKRRLRPDQLTEEEARRVARISPVIRLHRLIARPLTHLRRYVLRVLLRRGEMDVPGSSAK